MEIRKLEVQYYLEDVKGLNSLKQVKTKDITNWELCCKINEIIDKVNSLDKIINKEN